MALRILLRIGKVLLIVICLILVASASSNLFFESRSERPEYLSPQDKAIIEEAFHLRGTVGESVWEGWSKLDIPLLLYNEEHVFLAGTRNPAPGWRSVITGVQSGGPWEQVEDSTLQGRAYYRQHLPNGGETPQAFTVHVGEVWAASMTTSEWTRIKMGNDMRDGLPPVVRWLVPYRAIARIFFDLALRTDGYICAVEHEGFHALQGIRSTGHFVEAEKCMSMPARRYPWENRTFNNAWKEELGALSHALTADNSGKAADHARHFLSLRRHRRESLGIDPNLVRLEQLREWEEGLGKYTELRLWELASKDTAYRPVAQILNDPDFGAYKGFRKKCTEELIAIQFQANAGETRFYYSGMAQAFLLDRISPRWKVDAFASNACLENFIAAALEGEIRK